MAEVPAAGPEIQVCSQLGGFISAGHTVANEHGAARVERREHKGAEWPTETN